MINGSFIRSSFCNLLSKKVRREKKKMHWKDGNKEGTKIYIRPLATDYAHLETEDPLRST